MDLAHGLTWAASRQNAVLVTLRADGRPQSSDIVYAVHEGTFLVSVTDDRAKTVNMRRDPRVVLHITEPSSWSYLSFDAVAELSDVATAPDDAAASALLEYYERVRGPHPDPDEYRRSMVEQGRLLATIVPKAVVGQTRD